MAPPANMRARGPARASRGCPGRAPPRSTTATPSGHSLGRAGSDGGPCGPTDPRRSLCESVGKPFSPAADAARADQRPPPWATISGRPNAPDRFSAVSTSSIGPGRGCRALACSSRMCVKPGGISSTWCVTSTSTGDAGRRRARTARATSSSRPPRSRPAAGSSSSSSSGSVMSDAGDLDALALALGEGAEVAVGRGGRRRTPRAGPSARCSSSASYASRQRPVTPYAAVSTTSRTVSPAGIRSASAALDEADARAQLEDVDPPQARAQQVGRARRRVHPAGRDLQQRRLAGTVGAEHHPPLAVT